MITVSWEYTNAFNHYIWGWDVEYRTVATKAAIAVIACS